MIALGKGEVVELAVVERGGEAATRVVHELVSRSPGEAARCIVLDREVGPFDPDRAELVACESVTRRPDLATGVGTPRRKALSP